MGNQQSSHKISAKDEAILDMKLQRDRLHAYQRKITTLTDLETNVAKKLLARGDRKGALVALKKKKYQQSLLSKTDQQLEQLEILINDVEFALVQKDVLFGLDQGTKVLTAIHKEMGELGQIEKLMATNEEARAYQEEVSDMLGGRLSNQDEEDVEDELQSLQNQVQNVHLPDVPTNPVSNNSRDRVAQSSQGIKKAVRVEHSEAALLSE